MTSMNNLISVSVDTNYGDEVLFSSRMVAEATGKDHGSVVIRDIKNMLKQLEIHPAKLQDDDFKGFIIKRKIYNGREVIDEILLNKELTMCLITGYDVKQRMRVIQRVEELEKAQRMPQTYIEALEALLASEKEKERLRLENVAKTEQVNKCVDYIGRQERYIGNLEHQLQNGITLPEFAKQLNGVNVNKVNAWAEKKGWVIRKGKEWKTTSSGRKQQKQYVYDVGSNFINPKTGEQMMSNKVVLTKDGAAKLYREYLKGNLPMLKYWNGEFTHDTYLDSL